jgi:hypothetical protein
MYGAPLGAFGGLVASAIRKHGLAYTATSGTPDVARVKHAVSRLGVHEWIRVDVTGQAPTTGKVVSIDPDRFEVAPAGDGVPVQFAYADVRGVRAKPMSRAAKAGIAVGTVFSVGLISLALCYSGYGGSCD